MKWALAAVGAKICSAENMNHEQRGKHEGTPLAQDQVEPAKFSEVFRWARAHVSGVSYFFQWQSWSQVLCLIRPLWKMAQYECGFVVLHTSRTEDNLVFGWWSITTDETHGQISGWMIVLTFQCFLWTWYLYQKLHRSSAFYLPIFWTICYGICLMFHSNMSPKCLLFFHSMDTK